MKKTKKLKVSKKVRTQVVFFITIDLLNYYYLGNWAAAGWLVY